ncbi:MAG: M48 family metallopeptidase [Oleiphilaceae bacterium]|nr:M48 family metallopeptidase [Oleiphilaceae bacterium]
MFRVSVVVILVVWIVGCASSPTGRHQLILVSDAQMNQMGAASFDKLKEGNDKLVVGKPLAYVRCISDAILIADQRNPADWEVAVFEDASPNAFALPGKKIGVHTGMISLAETPDQLAAVIGHEIAHVDARHGAERVSLAMTNQVAQQVGAIALEGVEYKPEILGALGLGAQFGVLLPYSRAHETEADYIGLYLMAQSGFDPSEAVALWQNMKKASGGKAPAEFMSTHPSNDRRIRDLEKEQNAVGAIYRAALNRKPAPVCRKP